MAHARAQLFVLVNGQPVANAFYSLVTTVTINLTGQGKSSDTANIDLDDTDGQILLPAKGAPVSISLAWEGAGPTVVFEGVIDTVKGRGDRGGGRMLSISAKSADVVKGKLKHKRHKHKDKAKFGDVAKEWGKEAGVKVAVHPSIASIERTYWAMHGESFIAWGSRIAAFLGATFKVEGVNAVFAPRSQGQSSSGQSLAGVTAKWGENLISWDVEPSIGRPEHKKFRTKFYHRHKADWKTGDKEPAYETEAEAEHTARFSEADEDGATSRSGSHSEESDRDRGTGTVTIDGEPAAQPEAPLTLIGTRPGIDGAYRISTVDHNYSRGGWTTTCGLVKPPAEAGKDKRKATTGAKPASSSTAPTAPAGGNTSTPTGTGGIGHA